jgi:hypothetical protein
MKRAKKAKTVEEKLDKIITLLMQLVAIEMTKGGVAQVAIGKRLGISTGSTNDLLKGYKAPKRA